MPTFLMFWAALFLTLLMASPSWAATRYVDNTLPAGCSNGSTTYDPTANAGAGECGRGSATIYSSVANGLAATGASDTLLIRGGTYDETLAIASSKSGTPAGYTTIARYQTETVTLRPTLHKYAMAGGTGRELSDVTYVVVDGIVIDGVNQGDATDTAGFGIQFHNGSHDIIFRNLEMKNVAGQIFVGSNDGRLPYNLTIQDSQFHDNRSTCQPGFRFYGLYLGSSTGAIIIERSVWYNLAGGAMQIYPGPHDGVVVRGNIVHDSPQCATSFNGAILVGNQSPASLPVTNAQFYDNVIYHNGYAAGIPGAHGIVTFGSPDGTKIWNNTIYDNTGVNNTYGIWNGSLATNTTVQNNLIVGNKTDAVIDNNPNGTGITVMDHNACTALEACGSSKQTLTAITDCTVSTTDFHLRTGTNVCVDHGETLGSVTDDFDGVSRPQGVLYDIGGYERIEQDTTAPAPPQGVRID